MRKLDDQQVIFRRYPTITLYNLINSELAL